MVFVLVAALAMLALPAFAAAGNGQKNPPPDSAIKSFTNSAGKAVPPEEMAPNVTQKKTPGGSEANWQVRGRDWWPYPNQEPPYSAPAQRVEKMLTDDVNVNGVVVLNTALPEASLQNVPAELLLKPESQLQQEAGYYIVKLEGRTRTGKEVAALERAGATLGEYINVNAYVARIPSSAYGAVMSLPFVTYVGDYHPAYKISPRIGLTRVPQSEITDYSTGLPRPWLFELRLHAGADINAVVNGLNQLGILVLPKDVVTSVNDKKLTTIMARFMPEKIIDVAKIPGVKFIQEHAFPILMASSTDPAAEPMLLQNNGVYTTNKSTGWKLWNEGLDGSKSGTPQIVTMMDSGLSTEMYHFSEDTVNVGALGSSHRKVVAYDTYGGGDTCVLDGGHGGKTSQRAVGSISNMTTNPDTSHTPNENWDDGIARGGKVYFQDIGTSSGISPPTDLGPSITAAIGKGSYIQNHSWGTSSNSYDTEASDLDAAIYSNPDMVVTVSAGNSGAGGQGTIGSPSTAKNCICVGGVDLAAPDYLFIDCDWDGTAACSGTTDNGSSRGPVATSNRIKPDICAYDYGSSTVGGENMADDNPHAMCQPGSSTYWDYVNTPYEGGTSFSAPEVAGVAAVVRDYFLSGYYPSGSATPADAITPSGSLVKAVILASGEPLNTTASPSSSIAIETRYSNDQGYGRVNLPSVLRIGSGAPYLWVQNRDSLGDGATKTTYYTINGNSMPLRIMMDYYDAAGNSLQKDCDLKVTIGSDVYWGNSFSGGWSVTGGSADHTNNTEGVFLDAAHGLPSSGTVQVDIIGYNDPGGMNYSLVVSGDVASQAVTQVSLDQGKYTCASTINITVNDTSATSPVSVTMTSKDSGGTTIDTQSVSCTGSGGVFKGSIVAGSGLTVADGGSVVATYVDGGSNTYTATASIDCQINVSDGGYLIEGGCDSTPSDPSVNGWVNEYYNQYMDADEYNSYTFGFNNLTGSDLSDVYVSLSFSGAGASHMQVFNSPVYVGAVPTDGLTGAVFQVYADASTPGLTDVNMDFAITSPADGYTTPVTLTQVQHLQTDDTIARQYECHNFDSGLSGGQDLVLTTNGFTGNAATANPWGNNTGTAGEDRTDGFCASSSGNKGVGMTGSNRTSSNFGSDADSVLTWNFQPALTGNAPNGQPYEYTWKWHSFYHSSEEVGNTTGAWGVFYNDQWNNSTWPTGDQVIQFPIGVAYYYQTVFDYNAAWDWESANTGTPDDPNAATPPPNQLMITFGSSVSGKATSGTWFSYGHEHAGLGGLSHSNRDIAMDDDELAYDEYHATAQSGAACPSGQVGVVAFDRYSYTFSGSDTAVLSVTDGNATAPLTVTVTSAGTGDSEDVTLTGNQPYFTGNLTIATNAGVGANNGTLFVTPNDTLTATYNDTDPSGSSTAYAKVECNGGDVVYSSNAQVSDNGDDDGYADNNETVVMDITIKNNMATALNNAQVTIFSNSTNIDCITDDTAAYGTVAAGATATNPSSDRFTFHVNSAVQCTDWQNPPTGSFTVVITGDGFDGSSTLQTFQIPLDLDATSGSTYTLTQNFNSDPGWAMGTVPDDDGTCTDTAYVNDFHWCSVCGNGDGGYGAWVGNDAFNTSGQTYSNYSSSALYSPVLKAGGNVTLAFDVAYGTEASYDGAIVQYSLNSGAWTTLGFSTPGQSATTTSDYCSPLLMGETAWNGATTTWTTTDTASVTATAGDSIQFRWRLGSDSVNGGAGYGVDNVNIGGLQQTVTCESTRNTGLAGCPSGSPPPVPDGKWVSGTPSTAAKAGTAGDIDLTWDASTCTATDYNLYYGNGSAVGTYTLAGSHCAMGTSGSNTWTAPAIPVGETFIWWTIVGTNGASVESSWGKDSAGSERNGTNASNECGFTTRDNSGTCP